MTNFQPISAVEENTSAVIGGNRMNDEISVVFFFAVIKILTCFRGRIVNLGISEAQLAVVRLNL
jgi:hypothetical protein